MPLPMKTLKEVAIELGMPEREIRMMVDSRKVRAVWKQSQLTMAPDEIAKLRRLRKSLPESALPPASAIPKAPPPPVTDAKGPPKRPVPGGTRPATGAGTTSGTSTGSGTNTSSGATAPLKRPALKLPPPPPQ